MACLDMYNNSPSPHPHPPPPPPPPSATMSSPRISFSNDFVESHHHNNHHNHHHSHHHHHHHHSSPASSDFEFSITNGNMLSSASADELFFKGRILPFKNNASHSQSQMQRTLRDELLHGEDEADLDFSLKPPKGSLSSFSSTSNRWKGFLGLKKSHIGSKKPEKSDASPSPSFDAPKKFSFAPQDSNLTKSPQDMVSNEGPSSTDTEMGI